MFKFKNLVNKIISECSENQEVVTEAVHVDDIRNMIKNMDKTTADNRRSVSHNYIKRLFHEAYDLAAELKLKEITRLISDASRDDSFIEEFIESLSNKELISKSIVPKLADALIKKYNADESLKTNLLKVLKESDNDMFGYNEFQEPQVKKEYLLQRILREIDASNITDADIKVFTPETFKEYTRKVKAEFSYALFLNNDKVIGVVYFDESGKILDVSQIAYWQYVARSSDTNLKKLLMNSDKIIAISNEYRKNIKYRDPYEEKTDNDVREENKERYRKTLQERKLNRNKENLKSQVEELIDAIKNDLIPYKEELMNLDVFDDDGDIAKTFISLKQQISKVKKSLDIYLNSKTSYASDNTVIYNIKELKTVYFRLMELLENK